MKRPWLRHDAEGAGRFVVGIIRTKPKKQQADDADLAYSIARLAGHWGRLALGDAQEPPAIPPSTHEAHDQGSPR